MDLSSPNPDLAFTSEERDDVRTRALEAFQQRFDVISKDEYNCFISYLNEQWCAEVCRKYHDDELARGSRVTLYYLMPRSNGYRLLLMRYATGDGWAWQRTGVNGEEMPNQHDDDNE